jgi:hypothetical protein
MIAATTSCTCCSPRAPRAASGQQKWLGNPDAAIQAAINSNLE